MTHTHIPAGDQLQKTPGLLSFYGIGLGCYFFFAGYGHYAERRHLTGPSTARLDFPLDDLFGTIDAGVYFLFCLPLL